MAVRVRACESKPGVNVVALSGRLDMGAAEADYPALRQAIAESSAGIVVDLGEVQFVSSSGFRMLLTALQEVQREKKRLALVRAQPPVYKIFKVAGLDARFRFFDDEAAALAAF